MFSNRNGTMERDFLPRVKTWKTVRQTRNQDAALAHKRVTAPLNSSLLSSSSVIQLSVFLVTKCGVLFRPENSRTGGRFSKVPKTFRARKAIRKTPTCLSCNAGLFICCKGNKNKSNCEVSCLETPSFWRYKENYVTRNGPEKFRTFRETGPRFVITRQINCFCFPSATLPRTESIYDYIP